MYFLPREESTSEGRSSNKTTVSVCSKGRRPVGQGALRYISSRQPGLLGRRLHPSSMGDRVGNPLEYVCKALRRMSHPSVWDGHLAIPVAGCLPCSASLVRK